MVNFLLYMIYSEITNFGVELWSFKQIFFLIYTQDESFVTLMQKLIFFWVKVNKKYQCTKIRTLL